MSVRRYGVSIALVTASLVAILVVGGLTAWYFLENNPSSQSPAQIGSTTTTTPQTSHTSTSNSVSTGAKRYSIPYNAATKTVRVYLEVLTNVGSDVNLNGTNKGAMKIYVPAGSNLNITFNNLATLPHNLLLVKNTTAVPNDPDVGNLGSILFGVGANASNYKFTGYAKNSQSGIFSNIVLGEYWLACGLLTHAGDGFWVSLVASSSVASPYVVITSPSLSPAAFG